MQRSVRFIRLATLALASSLPVFSHAASILTDTFGSSTMNAAAPAAPTATSTDYAVLSSKVATASSIAAGHLITSIPSTSSGLVEVQAKFAATPVQLAAVGDYVQLSITFVPQSINTAGSATLGGGLYVSGGTTPVTGGAMTSSGMGSGVAFVNGYAKDWLGYVSKVSLTAGELFTRPAQNGPDNENQDLIFHDGVTGGFDNPDRSNLPGQATGLTLTNGSTYTYTFKVTMAAGGVLDIAQNFYDGAGTGGTNLYTHSGTTTVAQTIATSFDALAFGYRAANGSGTPHSMDLSQLEVTTNVAIPEPASLGILALGAIGLIRRRK
jgi:hypothetical protein